MSICTYAFLGPNIDNIDAKVVQAFRGLGFGVEVHPEMSFVESPAGGCLYVQIKQAPSNLKRVRPDAPLLVSMEYEVRDEKQSPRSKDWPPRGVKRCTYSVSTRTASGRSRAAFYVQALTCAILAKETGGYYYVDADEKAQSGSEGLDRVVRELNGPSELEFDANALPFEGWPPTSHEDPFQWPSPIKSLYVEAHLASQTAPKRRIKFSLFGALGYLLVLYFLVVGFLYS